MNTLNVAVEDPRGPENVRNRRVHRRKKLSSPITFGTNLPEHMLLDRFVLVNLTQLLRTWLRVLLGNSNGDLAIVSLPYRDRLLKRDFVPGFCLAHKGQVIFARFGFQAGSGNSSPRFGGWIKRKEHLVIQPFP